MRKNVLVEPGLQKTFEGEKLQVAFDICDICCCMSGIRVSVCGEGDFGPIWLTVTHSLHLSVLS